MGCGGEVEEGASEQVSRVRRVHTALRFIGTETKTHRGCGMCSPGMSGPAEPIQPQHPCCSAGLGGGLLLAFQIQLGWGVLGTSRGSTPPPLTFSQVKIGSPHQEGSTNFKPLQGLLC